MGTSFINGCGMLLQLTFHGKFREELTVLLQFARSSVAVPPSRFSAPSSHRTVWRGGGDGLSGLALEAPNMFASGPARSFVLRSSGWHL